MRMPSIERGNTSRSLSPTTSYTPWRSSRRASAGWTALMIASSAARCSVSLSRRCVSSNSRAFSSATPMLAATVDSRRTSASPKASSRSWFSTMTVPRKRSPENIGTKTDDRLWSVPSKWKSPSASAVAPVRWTTTGLALAAAACRSAGRAGRAPTARSRRTPCSYAYSRCANAGGRASRQLIARSPVAKTSRSLSPTRSTIAWKSSSALTPCWMLSITASSAVSLLEFRARCPATASRSSAAAAPLGERRDQLALGAPKRPALPSTSA